MKLLTQRMILREFQQEDYSALRDMEMHPQIYYYESKKPADEIILMYLENAQSDAKHKPRTRYRFALIIKETNAFCGRVTLSLNNQDIKGWEIGWGIHPDHWGQGFATEAALILMEFAFKELHTHRVIAFSHHENIASIRVMRKLGMHHEGLLRETRMRNDTWSDEVVFSILDREWDMYHSNDKNF